MQDMSNNKKTPDSQFNAKTPANTMSKDGLSVRDILSHAAGKTDGSPLTIDDIDKVIMRSGVSGKDARHIRKAAGTFLNSSSDYKLGDKGTYQVIENGKGKTSSSKEAGNKVGFQVSDLVGLGNNISTLVGLADLHRGTYKKSLEPKTESAPPTQSEAKPNAQTSTNTIPATASGLLNKSTAKSSVKKSAAPDNSDKLTKLNMEIADILKNASNERSIDLMSNTPSPVRIKGSGSSIPGLENIPVGDKWPKPVKPKDKSFIGSMKRLGNLFIDATNYETGLEIPTFKREDGLPYNDKFKKGGKIMKGAKGLKFDDEDLWKNTLDKSKLEQPAPLSANKLYLPSTAQLQDNQEIIAGADYQANKPGKSGKSFMDKINWDDVAQVGGGMAIAAGTTLAANNLIGKTPNATVERVHLGTAKTAPGSRNFAVSDRTPLGNDLQSQQMSLDRRYAVADAQKKAYEVQKDEYIKEQERYAQGIENQGQAMNTQATNHASMFNSQMALQKNSMKASNIMDLGVGAKDTLESTLAQKADKNSELYYQVIRNPDAYSDNPQLQEEARRFFQMKGYKKGGKLYA